MDTGIISAVGSINLTTLLLRRFASFGRTALHTSVTREGAFYEFRAQLDSPWPSRLGGVRQPRPSQPRTLWRRIGPSHRLAWPIRPARTLEPTVQEELGRVGPTVMDVRPSAASPRSPKETHSARRALMPKNPSSRLPHRRWRINCASSPIGSANCPVSVVSAIIHIRATNALVVEANSCARVAMLERVKCGTEGSQLVGNVLLPDSVRCCPRRSACRWRSPPAAC